MYLGNICYDELSNAPIFKSCKYLQHYTWYIEHSSGVLNVPPETASQKRKESKGAYQPYIIGCLKPSPNLLGHHPINLEVIQK